MLPELLRRREQGRERIINSHLAYSAEWLVNNIDHYKELEGHSGCVNTLKWNQSGSLLASGSDDRTMKLWSVEGSLLHSYETSHRGNIFGVEFMPGTKDRFVMTCAADHRVVLRDLEVDEELAEWETRGRVKRIATSQHFAQECWSISEDRAVRVHDSRSYHAEEVLKIHQDGKSIALSPLQRHLVAVACDHFVVGVYDRRSMKRPLIQLVPADKRPEHNSYVTHVTFSSITPHLIANYGRSSVYVFDLEQKDFHVPFFHHIEMLKKEVVPMEQVTKLESHRLDKLEEEWVKLYDKKTIYEYIAQYTTALQSKDWDKGERVRLLVSRAKGYLMRKMEGDSYAAARDYIEAALLFPEFEHGLECLVSTLMQMEEYDLAMECSRVYKQRYTERADMMLKYEEIVREDNDTGKKKSNIRQLNRGRRDYSERLTGHTNDNTDIKEANFFGPNEEFIVAGSDCGNVFIYDRKTERIVTCLKADSSITNIVQPHPFLPLLASSGIDDSFHLFAPFKHPDRDESYRREYDSSRAGRNPRAFLRNIVLQNFLEEGRSECILS